MKVQYGMAWDYSEFFMAVTGHYNKIRSPPFHVRATLMLYLVPFVISFRDNVCSAVLESVMMSVRRRNKFKRVACCTGGNVEPAVYILLAIGALLFVTIEESRREWVLRIDNSPVGFCCSSTIVPFSTVLLLQRQTTNLCDNITKNLFT